MRKKVGEFFEDVYPDYSPFVETRARTDFKAARRYAVSLIEIHDAKTGGKAGRPPEELEALKRSALILAVTAWESFVEDTVQEQLELNLTRARSPVDVQSVFNTVANEWLDPSGERPKPPTLNRWTGDSWKNVILASLENKLMSFHTPNTENTDDLFKRYLGYKNLSDNWSWQRVSAAEARKKLDALIKMRGRAVHRGKRGHPLSAPEPPIGRNTVIDALNLIYNLVHSTETALGIGPSIVPAPPPPP